MRETTAARRPGLHVNPVCCLAGESGRWHWRARSKVAGNLWINHPASVWYQIFTTRYTPRQLLRTRLFRSSKPLLPLHQSYHTNDRAWKCVCTFNPHGWTDGEIEQKVQSHQPPSSPAPVAGAFGSHTYHVQPLLGWRWCLTGDRDSRRAVHMEGWETSFQTAMASLSPG